MLLKKIQITYILKISKNEFKKNPIPTIPLGDK